MSHPARLAGLMIAASLAASATAHSLVPIYYGPVAYHSDADSPLLGTFFAICVEDFEDGTFDVPGASGNGVVVGPGGLTDSVDGDDGVMDGSGSAGRSYFSLDGSAGITITFTEGRTNGYPTRVGIVWTDGGPSTPVTIEGFDHNGVSLGTHGPFVHADASNSGETAEDVYYGVTSFQGISKITISNATGGIEVDHLQLDNCIVCGDTNFDLHVKASDALSVLKTSVGSDRCQLCVCDTNDSTTITVSDALAVLRTSVGLAQALDCPSCTYGEH